MKKIKVIDLLNIIASGEKIPNKIKWGDHNLTWYIYEHKALDELGDPNLFKCAGCVSRSLLNDEVEIIEEPRDIEVCGSLFTKSEYDELAKSNEDKKIDKLDLSDWVEITSSEDCKPEMLATLFNKNAIAFSSKINEIIEVINGRNI